MPIYCASCNAKISKRHFAQAHVCGRCYATAYCGAACQSAHWPSHADACALAHDCACNGVDAWDDAYFASIGSEAEIGSEIGAETEYGTEATVGQDALIGAPARGGSVGGRGSFGGGGRSASPPMRSAPTRVAPMRSAPMRSAPMRSAPMRIPSPPTRTSFERFGGVRYPRVPARPVPVPVRPGIATPPRLAPTWRPTPLPRWRPPPRYSTWRRPGPFSRIGYGWRGGWGWSLMPSGYYYNPFYASIYPRGVPWWMVAELLENAYANGWLMADYPDLYTAYPLATYRPGYAYGGGGGYGGGGLAGAVAGGLAGAVVGGLTGAVVGAL